MHETRGMKTMRVFTVPLVSVAFCIACHPTGASGAEPSGNTREVFAMKSFGGGLQIFLPI
jgi:hypothetical protein